MSSRSRRSPVPPPALVLGLVLAAALAAPASAQLSGKAKRPRPKAPAKAAAPAAVADDSTQYAQGMIADLRALYGGDDSWARIEGFRYYVQTTIPGPDGAPVREWTEAHHVWAHGAPRARIDVAEDSTIVVVRGDTTWVRRAGAWMTDSVVVAAGRAQALDALWTWRLPRNLLDPRIKARQLSANVRGEPLVTRFLYEKPGLDRPPGTVLTITFAPPGYAMRTLHWYDPRAGAWYRLELADDRKRYGFTWAGRRTLHASDAAGEKGPVLWTARLEDVQVEARMPGVVLAPPGAGPGVVTPGAPADTVVTVTDKR